MESYHLKIKAPAKINYFLEIEGLRNDDYHEIVVIFQTISLFDELFFEEKEGDIEVFTDSEDLQEPGRNLIYKAASLLRRLKSVERGAKIFLRKNIPIGAGLGGGSSDAACVLTGLSILWGLDPEDPILLECAQKLGADVPFFLSGGTALGRGRGDIISPLEMEKKPDLPILLVCPDFRISSADAYKLWDEENCSSRGEGPEQLVNAFFRNDLNGMANNVFNDFEKPVTRHYPVIKEIKKALLKEGAMAALMSGSGSAVYGIFDNPEKIDRVSKTMKFPGRIIKTKTI